MTIKQIETKIAAALAKEIGVLVNVTNRAADAWTISGADADTRKAADWLQAQGLMAVEGFAVYEDDGEEETYCYLKRQVKLS